MVPLTSNTSRVYTFQARLPAAECGLAKGSKVQCEQVRAVARERFLKRLGVLPRRYVTEIEVALRRHLAL